MTPALCDGGVEALSAVAVPGSIQHDFVDVSIAVVRVVYFPAITPSTAQATQPSRAVVLLLLRDPVFDGMPLAFNDSSAPLVRKTCFACRTGANMTIVQITCVMSKSKCFCCTAALNQPNTVRLRKSG